MTVMGKLSSAVLSMVESHQAGRCNVNILYEHSLSENDIVELNRQLVMFGCENIEFRHRMAMIHATASVDVLNQIASIEGVSWIDLQKAAPMNSVLD